MTRSRAIYAAASLAAVLLVSGCDDDPPVAPTPEPTSHSASPDASPSASPTATAVVVAPERPDAMDDDGAAGAEAAAVYFQMLDSYMMATGDTSEWEALSHESCQTCADRLEQAQLIAKNRDIFEGGEATVRLLHTYEQDAATGIWPMDLEIRTAPATITTPEGEVVADFEEGANKIRIEVARSDGRWVVLGIVDLDEE